MAAPNPLKDRWSRLPSDWIVKGGLLDFRAGKTLGQSIAALKVLIAVLLHAKNVPAAARDEHQGTLMISYGDLMGLTDLARAMVSVGIKRLEALQRISVTRGRKGEPNRYHLPDYGETNHWAKISNRRLFRGTNSARIAVLHDLSARRTCDLDALKLYLLLSAMQNRSGSTMLGYDKIIEYSGIPQNRIRRAVSVLVEQGLIAVSAGPDPEVEKHNPPNRYRLLGISSIASNEEEDVAGKATS